MEGFKELSSIATADVAYELFGPDLTTLFQNAVYAFLAATVHELPEELSADVEKGISLNGKDSEELLYSFLSELVYLKDVDTFIALNFDGEVLEEGELKVNGVLRGITYERVSEMMRMDIKAVTKHMFEVEHTDEGYKAMVVFDV